MGVRLEVQSLWTKEEPSTFVYEFDQSRIMIGRSRSADVQLPHAAVSSTHASIRTEGSGYVLIDEGSTNGTRVNEAPCVAGRPKPLQAHDVVDVGGYRVSVQIGVPVANATSAKLTTRRAYAMLDEQDNADPARTLEERLNAIQSSADQSIPLLPIPRESTSVPPPRTSTSPPSEPPPRPRRRIGTTELMVYSMAGLLLAASLVIMFFLSRS